MTSSEAAALLGVADDVSPTDLRRRYEALHTDYQIRLTNAPTPALKRTYQQKLQDLLDAADRLCPGFSGTQSASDLPAVEPVLDDLTPASRVPTPTRKPVAAHTVVTSTPGSGALPMSTIIAGVAAVVLATALSFVLIRWSGTASELSALQAKDEKLLEAARGFEARLAANERVFFADRLRVRNASSKPSKITAVALVFRDQSGALKVAHSGTFDYPTWDIKPGTMTTLDAEMARGRLWDGPVLYYALLIEYPGVEPFLRAGVWADDVDRLEKAITLDLD